jgi:hypothetical protein
VAEIVTAVDVATPVVTIGKTAEEDPTGIEMLGGVEATAELELESATVIPPAPVESPTTPVTGRPPFTGVGETVTEVRADD